MWYGGWFGLQGGCASKVTVYHTQQLSMLDLVFVWLILLKQQCDAMTVYMPKAVTKAQCECKEAAHSCANVRLGEA